MTFSPISRIVLTPFPIQSVVYLILLHFIFLNQIFQHVKKRFSNKQKTTQKQQTTMETYFFNIEYIYM